MSVPNSFPDLRKLERELVAEQPGLAVGVAGLLLAFFIGAAVRSAVNSERIFQLVSQAAERVDPRVVAHIGSARISLSDGIFPELAVVVRDVSMESNEVCWMRPSLELDELKLPIDVLPLLRGQVSVHEVYANEVSLSLRSDLGGCGKNKAATTLDLHGGASRMAAAVGRAESEPAGSNERLWDQLSSAKNVVDFVRIETLRIHYLPMLFTSLELRHLEVNVKSQSPRKMDVSGIVNLNGETLSGDYSSTAVLSMGIDETKNPAIESKIDGNWREGHYSLQASYQPADQNLQLNYDMTQIPLNQLLPLLRKYRAIHSDFNGRQTWLTLRGTIGGKASEIATKPLRVDLFRLEGAIGEVDATDLQIMRLDPLQLRPFDLNVKALQLDNLLGFLNRPHPTPALGHLGVFHGKVHVTDANNLQVKGEHSGLEVVFSSRGSRQVQVISLLEGDVTLSQQKWNLKVDHIKPLDGVFLGNVVVDADQNWSRASVKLRLDELTLSPQIQKLITNGGEVKSISGEVFSRFEKAKMIDLRGNLAVSDLLTENLGVKKTKVLLATKQEEFLVDLRSQGVSIKEGGEPYRYLMQVVEPKKPGLFEFTSAGAEVRTRHLTDLSWQDFVLSADHGSIHSRGGWNENAELHGTLDVQEKGKKHSYRIDGVRDRPILTKLK